MNISKLLNLTVFMLLVIMQFILISCKKDLTDSKDITSEKWELKCVSTGNDNYKPKNKVYLRNDAYLIKFGTDSTFTLNTSVNYAGGQYAIPKNGEILIYLYEETTEIATTDNDENLLNKNLLSVFSEVTTYEVLGNKLIFKGPSGEVVFKKK